MLKSLAVLTVALGLTLLPAAAQVETIAYLPGVQKVISEKPSVLIFSAPWCMACRKLDGVLSKVKRQYKHDVDFTKVHVQDPKNLELVKRYDCLLYTSPSPRD